MDEQEQQAAWRRCGIFTAVMIAAGLAVLAAQGDPAADGAPASTRGAANMAGAPGSTRIADREGPGHPARQDAPRGALAVPAVSASAAIQGK